MEGMVARRSSHRGFYEYELVETILGRRRRAGTTTVTSSSTMMEEQDTSDQARRNSLAVVLDGQLLEKLREFDEDNDRLGIDAVLTDFCGRLLHAFAESANNNDADVDPNSMSDHMLITVTSLEMDYDFLQALPVNVEVLMFKVGLSMLRRRLKSIRIVGDEGTGLSSTWGSYQTLFRDVHRDSASNNLEVQCNVLTHFEISDLDLSGKSTLQALCDTLMHHGRCLESLLINCLHYHRAVDLDCLFRSCTSVHMPHLRVLRVRPCDDSRVFWTSKGLEHFLEMAPKIESLQVTHLFHNQHLAILERNGRNHACLRHLAMTHNARLTSVGLECLLRLVQQNPRITKVELPWEENDVIENMEDDNVEDDEQRRDDDANDGADSESADSSENNSSSSSSSSQSIDHGLANLRPASPLAGSQSDNDANTDASAVTARQCCADLIKSITFFARVNAAGRAIFLDATSSKALRAYLLARHSHEPEIMWQLLCVQPDLV